MSIYCSFTVVQIVCVQLPAVHREKPGSPRRWNTAVSLALTCQRSREGVDLETVSGNSADSERFKEKQIKQPFSVLHAVRMQCCWPVRPPGCENNQLPSTRSCFFTLYILSIFTHKMYMIGMHIIFLLTDSFNKALSICCRVSTLCSLCAAYSRLNFCSV